MDWERVSLSGYWEAVEANNELYENAGEKKPVDEDRLRRLVTARAND